MTTICGNVGIHLIKPGYKQVILTEHTLPAVIFFEDFVLGCFLWLCILYCCIAITIPMEKPLANNNTVTNVE